MKNREGDRLVGRGGQCGKGTLVCVRVRVLGDLEVRVGVRGRAGGTESRIFLAVDLGPCLFWGNHDAEAGVGVSSRPAGLTEVEGEKAA